MPKLPQPTAQGRQAIANIPQVSPWQYGEHAFRDLTQAGLTLEHAGEAIQRQQDDIHALRIASAYDIQSRQAVQDISRDPEFLTAEMSESQRRLAQQNALEDKLSKIRESLTDNVSVHVKRVIEGHAAQQLPSAVEAMHVQTLRIRKDDNDAQLYEFINERATAIPQMNDRQQRERSMQDVRLLLDRSVREQLLSRDDADKKWTQFESGVLEHQMDYLRRTNRSELRKRDLDGEFNTLGAERRFKILAQANGDDEREQNAASRAFDKVRIAVLDYYKTRANQGAIGEDELHDLITKGSEYLKPDDIRSIVEHNSHPLTLKSDDAVKAVMLDYHAGASTQENILKARKRLLSLETKSPDLDKAFNELQTDERTMLGIRAAEISAGIKQFEDAVKGGSKPLLPGAFGQMEKNKQEADLAQGRNRIRKGESPEKVGKELIEKQKAKKDAMTDKEKKIMDLVK